MVCTASACFPLFPTAQAFRRGGQLRRPLLLRVPLPGRAPVGSEDSLSSPTSSFVLAPAAFALGDRSTGRESLLQQIAQAFVTARPKRAVPASSRLNALRSAFDSSSWHECVNPAKAIACCDCVRRCSSAGQAPDNVPRLIAAHGLAVPLASNPCFGAQN